MPTDPFNLASVSTLLSVAVTTIAAACAFLLGRVPDWDDVRPLTWVALTAAAAAGCSFTATLDVPSWVYLWTNRLQVTAIALHVVAWHVYLPRWGRRTLTPRRRAALWGLVAAGLAALWPGAVYGDAIALRPLEWAGLVYHDPVVTPAGAVMYAVIGAYGLWGVGLSLRYGRAGAPLPWAHLACTVTILVMAVHDALVVVGLPLPTPYLIDFAFYGPITVLGLVTIQRVGSSANELRRLGASLAGLAAKRASALEQSQSALARAERLAALGQFAAGVAREVHDPATIVASNLDLLAAELRDDPRDRLWTSLRDAEAGTRRIVALSRQLLLAGRTAGGLEEPLGSVNAAWVVEAAMGAARPLGGPRLAWDVRVSPAIHLRAHEDSLVQVVSNLLVNAAHAIPAGRGGRVCVRAEERGDEVRLVVEDDGAGMSEEALLHVFEPYHGTRPPEMGTGLGLAVSLGLVTSMQGRLAVESTLGRGTRAVVELRRAQAPAPGGLPTPAPLPAAPARSRILIVDDDEDVLSSMARLIGRAHEVSVAAGLGAGLDAVASGEFDLVLCDVTIHGGGGERFWAELPLRAPQAMPKVAFMTAGSVPREARAFLAGQPQPILAKPFDLAMLQDVLVELRAAGRSSARRSVARLVRS